MSLKYVIQHINDSPESKLALTLGHDTGTVAVCGRDYKRGVDATAMYSSM